ncbi:MAG TPA: YbhB/YbcL family Raf kinase inhibitor-like protein [Ignavibacteriaceae bacterium]|nr:YbhB/YbcL family Raf kinase inhibitor-like protein [Ignavibacteriaceae bacterium]
MSIKVTSSAFENGEFIPAKYTCDGANISPPLSWSGIPEGAKTLALIADDPDAPGRTFVHWVIFNLPVHEKELLEGVTPSRNISEALMGTNDFGHIGYGGPCPPSGTHRYFFKLYALNSAVHLEAGATKDQLLKAMEKHILGQGELMGKYKRKK